MSKSIFDKAFDIAEEREKKHFDEMVEDFRNIMDKKFQEHLDEVKEWKAIGDNYYQYSFSDFFNIDFLTLEKIATKLGFAVTSLLNGDSCYGLSIPLNTKGEKFTVAQTMLSEFNIKLAEKIKNEKDLAKTFCKNVFEKIVNEKFDSKAVGKNCYIITVHELTSNSSVFESEVQKLMEKENFSDIQLGINHIKMTLKKD